MAIFGKGLIVFVHKDYLQVKEKAKANALRKTDQEN